MTDINYSTVTLKKGEGRALKAGGAWVYDNEIASIKGGFTNGSLVKVVDFDEYPMGIGVINQNSVIRVRMLTRRADAVIDSDFWHGRMQRAWDYRKTVLGGGNNLTDVNNLPHPGVGNTGNADLNACRVVFGEADNVPGMVIDKYGDLLVVESLSLGTDMLKKDILTALIDILEHDGIVVRGIFERSDAPVRKKEGMQPRKGYLYAGGRFIDETAADGIAGSRFVEGTDASGNADDEYYFDTNIEIYENGIRYLVDIKNGQKTGFFLDQKYNRLAMQKICGNLVRQNQKLDMSVGAQTPAEPDEGCGSAADERSGVRSIRVLDCFTHMGTFALNCGLAMKQVLEDKTNAFDNSTEHEGDTEDARERIGASTAINVSVTGLDISEYAVSQATQNSVRNGLENIVKFRAANVLDELPRLIEAGEKYDVVVLDPPAFTKSREATKNAIKGYREINMKGMRLVRDGGYLATCSCSHFMTQELFTQMLSQAAKAVHKRLRQIEIRTQAPDHPILWAADESYYLKFFIFQVVEEV